MVDSTTAMFGEIEARDPEYLQACGLCVPATAEVPAALDLGGVRFPLGEALRAHLRDVHACVSARGIACHAGEGLLAYVLAAGAADRQLVPGVLHPQGSRPGLRHTGISRTPRGVAYRWWGRGARATVLINARGMPLSPWARFLADADTGQRVYVVDEGGWDMVHGGMDAAIAADRAASAALDVIDHEQLKDLTLVAWSNGAGAALHVAAEAAPADLRLVLVAPALAGQGLSLDQRTSFQRAQRRMLQAAAENPSRADAISELLCRRWLTPMQWSRVEAPMRVREETLLRLPARDLAADLLAPLSSGDRLLLYARQSMMDDPGVVSRPLQQVRARALPVLLLTGAHDEFVDNAATRRILDAAGVEYTEACILGAGHYPQDLQYGYFRTLLRAFVDDAIDAMCLNRVAVRDSRTATGLRQEEGLLTCNTTGGSRGCSS